MWNVQAVTMAVLLIISASPAFAEGNAIKGNAIKLPLNDASQVAPRNVTVKAARYCGNEPLLALLSVHLPGPSQGTSLFFPGMDFSHGTLNGAIPWSVLRSRLNSGLRHTS